MGSERLLLCPFCGCLPEIKRVYIGREPAKEIHCNNDHCYVRPRLIGVSLDEAVKRWNRRVDGSEYRGSA